MRSRGAILLFNDKGVVEHVFLLDSASENLGFDIPAGWYHTIVSLELGSVFSEVKAGPYEPTKAKEFATWAPPENALEAPAYLEKLKNMASRFY